MEKMDVKADRFMTVEKFINDLIVFHGEIQKLKASESYYKKMAETFQASQKNWKSMLENLPGKIFLKDKNCRYTFCNEGFAQGFKVKPEMVIGKSDFDLFPAEFAEKTVNNDKRIMEIGATEESEETFFYDTKKITANFFRTPIKNETGEVIGILGVFWDITEKKEKEEDLREKYANLESLLGSQKNELNEMSGKYEKELTESGILKEKYSNLTSSFDAQADEFKGLNAKYQKELSESGVLREKYSNLRNSFDAQAEELNEISAKYQKELAESRILKEKYSNLRSSFEAQTDELNGMNAKYQKELSESGVLKGKIKKLEENYQALFENAEAAIAEVEENAIISTLNEGFEKLTGLSKNEVEGRMSIKDFFVNEDLEKVNKILSSAGGILSTNGVHEFTLLDKNRNVRVVSMFAHPTTDGRRCLLFLKDITNSKQAEGKLRDAISQFRGLMNEMEKTLKLN